MNLWAVVLAGNEDGSGPSQSKDAAGIPVPKQFFSVGGGPTLLHKAMARALRVVHANRVICVVNSAHRDWWEPVLRDFEGITIVAQPGSRGTGVSVLLPHLVISQSDAAARVLCLPSDRLVANESVLTDAIRRAVASTSLGCDTLTILGTPPNAPHSGSGYVSANVDAGVGMRPIRRFVETPRRETATQPKDAGNFWNTGIFIGAVRAVLNLYPRHVPGLSHRLKLMVDRWPDKAVPSAELIEFYKQLPEIDFWRGVVQKQPARLQLLAVPLDGSSDARTAVRPTAMARELLHQPDPRVTSVESSDSVLAVASRAMAGTMHSDRRGSLT